MASQREIRAGMLPRDTPHAQHLDSTGKKGSAALA